MLDTTISSSFAGNNAADDVFYFRYVVVAHLKPRPAGHADVDDELPWIRAREVCTADEGTVTASSTNTPPKIADAVNPGLLMARRARPSYQSSMA